MNTAPSSGIPSNSGELQLEMWPADGAAIRSETALKVDAVLEPIGRQVFILRRRVRMTSISLGVM